ncbi:iron-sulfur cluster repair di-iron protein [Shewanella eurypsychrophilus]|uniref:Iron-sulfur cluster repair di-iron protein n=1 Tax=Shewanella eurypsychrophilus TaxID=2593656 RepID=A0ABX6V3Q5_9GAMM|nr:MULTISPECIES: iron-sulfur cluster repair di-iron protein [Shewanella]QFU21131.1 iron-sulfur cluster repair di-iron protein [Shewanella sp. YLB-09]QPG56422.1 iron-sulfur cluster repair di-iron protein [Shewanella eurypsychrophilus]
MSTTSQPVKDISQQRVGQLVADDFRAAHIFSQFGIDFCCGGGRSLASACEKADAKLSEVEAALLASAVSGQKEDSLNQLPVDQLIDYIEDTHHTYVREKAPLLIEYSQKMVRAHGEHYEEIKPLAGWIQALIEDLVPHLMKEERILFPSIRAMAAGEQVNGCFGHIGNPINAMEHDHNDASLVLEKIRELTNNYQPPQHACTTWRVCYASLAEFEADLMQHIHIENNILFTKALSLAE